MATISSIFPGDLNAVFNNILLGRHAVERASKTLRAFDESCDLVGESVARTIRNASVQFDPIPLGIGANVGPVPTAGVDIAAKGLAEFSTQWPRGVLLGDSLASSAFAKFSTSMHTGQLVRQMKGSANALAAASAPFLRFDNSMYSVAVQVAESLRTARIDALALTPSWQLLLEHRLRVRRWLGDLGSDSDPASVELVEVDGIEYGGDFKACWFTFLGKRVEGQASGPNAGVMTFGDTTLKVWGIRIYHDHTDTYVEIRNPPWGTGEPDIRSYDPFRPASSLRVITGLGALGYGRQRGRRALTELWEQEKFHRAYHQAESVVRSRRAGKRGSQLEIAAELDMSDRHLRRLIKLYGLPGEKRS